MALLKSKDLEQFSHEELNQRIEGLRKEFYELTQKNEIGQLDRPHRLRQIRREIAQILTIMNRKPSE